MKKLVHKEQVNIVQLKKVFKIMSHNPFDSSLKTHKVQTRVFDLQYSSKVTKDLRLIWNFGKERLTILLIFLYEQI